MIFIIEDDEATRDSLRLLLECEGFEAGDFADAGAFLKARWPQSGDCLILDLNLPGISGLELLQSLRRDGSPVPVIVITGRPTPANRRRAEQLGALAMLEKPYAAEELLVLVRQALGRTEPRPCRC